MQSFNHLQSCKNMISQPFNSWNGTPIDVSLLLCGFPRRSIRPSKYPLSLGAEEAAVAVLLKRQASAVASAVAGSAKATCVSPLSQPARHTALVKVGPARVLLGEIGLFSQLRRRPLESRNGWEVGGAPVHGGHWLAGWLAG